MVGVAPFLGGAMLTFIFVKAFLDYKTTSTDVNYSGGFLGVGTPVAIGVGGLLVGVVYWCSPTSPTRSSSSASGRRPTPGSSRGPSRAKRP